MLNPWSRIHFLCASMSAWQFSSPFSTMLHLVTFLKIVFILIYSYGLKVKTVDLDLPLISNSFGFRARTTGFAFWFFAGGRSSRSCCCWFFARWIAHFNFQLSRGACDLIEYHLFRREYWKPICRILQTGFKDQDFNIILRTFCQKNEWKLG